MSLARQVWHVELEGDGEVGGDRCTTLLDNPAQNDWVVISRAEDSGNGVGVCPGDGCVVMQVAGVKGCGGINNAADGKALGAAQNLSELECDVGEARLDGYREDPPCRGCCIQHKCVVRDLDYEDDGARKKRARAARHRACLRGVALTRKNSFAHSLLVGRRHVLEVHDTTLGSLGSQLLDPLEIFLVGLGCALDDGGLSTTRADDLSILHPRMVAATTEACQRPAFAALGVAVDCVVAVAGEGLLSLAWIR